MIGKTLYRAKTRDGKIVIIANTIVQETPKFYYFSKKKSIKNRELKVDVGVVCFLTKAEAMEFLIKRLKRSINMGNEHIAKERVLLAEALKSDDGTIRFRNFYYHCNTEWQDDGSTVCDDICPVCNLSIGPYKSEDI